MALGREDMVANEAVAERRAAEALVVDIDGFEGPLDLLLTLARSQKLDLRQISILQLARQYLQFVETAQGLRIELAAEYLLMAAWLAYLKSRLLLPPDPEEEGPSGEELAAELAFQLERLQAMREAAARLLARDQKGRDFFARGQTDEQSRVRHTSYSASLLDLLQAYARVRTRDEFRPYVMDREDLMTMEEALKALRAQLGSVSRWTEIAQTLPQDWRESPTRRRSATAATFAASLELVKEGRLYIRQAKSFAPVEIRDREATS